MIQRRKSTPADDLMLNDENADPVERSSAISRLVADNFTNFEPTLIALLDHPHFILRGEAIKVLLSAWKLPKYVDTAVTMLRSDPEWEVRADAVCALSWFAQRTGQQRGKIIGELAKSLLNDTDWAVQENCYRELLVLLNTGKKHPDYSRKFDRERDVDWEMLKPYLNDSQIPQPQTTR